MEKYISDSLARTHPSFVGHIHPSSDTSILFFPCRGHVEYRVMPFGLSNSPAVFQALVNDHVRRVLLRLLENGLFAKKLAPKLIGPFTVTKILSPVAVRLKLPPAYRRIHPVFHVSKLKPVYSVKCILDLRRRGRGFQYLVDWESYGPEERSWVPARDILDHSLIDDYNRQNKGAIFSQDGCRGNGRPGREGLYHTIIHLCGQRLCCSRMALYSRNALNVCQDAGICSAILQKGNRVEEKCVSLGNAGLI
ncbi:Retrovirus-related Pol polyprotein from transposon 17.6 [Labeo rohita]|uniref:Retrovirus-related Pol polyprotein from transposon 17.6 n=1 Tax=Labeo rohita TaxID=84645 RepID=A0ABQ8LKC8_LABRO|nr:Retrovirus-related Pol polyprotein from transposon 17.6 [Labeo rohita]